jgi:peptide deformylase
VAGARVGARATQYNSMDMSILKIARMGHPALRVKARAIERADIRGPAVQKLIDDMIETMIEYRGVGLAAPQVREGVRLFVATLPADDDEDEGEGEGEGRHEGEDDARSGTVVIINPELIPVRSETLEDWEGCLSIPDIRGRVPRAREIIVRALDRYGERIELRAHDYPARVIQHETDHLDGILFFDRMRSFESLTFLEEYSRYWVKDR